MAINLYLCGASGHGKVIADIAEKIGSYRILGFLDDNAALHGETLFGYTIYPISILDDHHEESFRIVVSIGNNAARRNVTRRLIEVGHKVETLIHPSAVISRGVEIGKGTVVMGGTVINADADIGSGCIINTGATIDHDCSIADWVHVSPGAHLAGAVGVGENSWIGIGSSVIEHVRIGRRCMVGGRAVVIGDIDDDSLVVGVPARKR